MAAFIPKEIVSAIGVLGTISKEEKYQNLLALSHNSIVQFVFCLKRHGFCTNKYCVKPITDWYFLSNTGH